MKTGLPAMAAKPSARGLLAWKCIPVIVREGWRKAQSLWKIKIATKWVPFLRLVWLWPFLNVVWSVI